MKYQARLRLAIYLNHLGILPFATYFLPILFLNLELSALSCFIYGSDDIYHNDEKEIKDALNTLKSKVFLFVNLKPKVIYLFIYFSLGIFREKRGKKYF